MGIDTARFSGDIDGDLLCPICSLVLEEPVQAPMCEHAFCNTCITEWLTSNQTCPIDRTNLTIDALKPAPRILRNFLSRLILSCSNQTHGCPASLTLERLETHILECNFNPKRQVTCQSGCGASILFEELQKHNCFQSLKIEMESKFAIVKKENEGKEEKISKMQLELDLLKAEIAALKRGNPEKQSLSPDSQLLPTAGQSQAVNQGTGLTASRWLTKFDSERFSKRLTRKSFVLRPDHLMLEAAKKLLFDSGCPSEMVAILIENSNESRWPPALRSAHARIANWDRIQNYIMRFEYRFSFNSRRQQQYTLCIIMASENAHMGQNLFVVNPGFLIFRKFA